MASAQSSSLPPQQFLSRQLSRSYEDNPGLPFEALIHFTNHDAKLDLASPWKDLSLRGDNEKQLSVQIDAAINPGNSGGPVFNQATNKVVGVAFAGLSDAEGIGYVIPMPVVRNFLDTFDATGTFGRLPNLGILVQHPTNASMRSLLFGTPSPPHHDGILVTKLRPFSCAADAGVQPGDIIMAIDGQAISEDGEVAFRGHERVDWTYPVTSKKVGDTVRLSILRHACISGVDMPKGVFNFNALIEKWGGADTQGSKPTPLELVVTLSPSHELLPRELGKDYTPSYCIVGGLVFVVAGVPLEMYLASSFARNLGERNRYSLLKTARGLASPEHEEEEELASDGNAQAALCTNCLAHEANQGYEIFVGYRVRSVNGRLVKNMRHLVELISPFVDPTVAMPSPSLVLQFYGSALSAIFSTESLREATPTIQAQHKVRSWSSLDMHMPGGQGARATQKRDREESA